MREKSTKLWNFVFNISELNLDLFTGLQQAISLTWDCGEGNYNHYCGVSKEKGQLMLRKLNSPVAFREGFLKATFGVRAAGCMTFF